VVENIFHIPVAKRKNDSIIGCKRNYFNIIKEKKMKNVHLVAIDPQTDFCDPKGNLYVAGAEKDMARLAKMVDRVSDKLEDIHVTLDSHHFVDVAHPIFWKAANGSHPSPFTIITTSDVKNGIWTPTKPSLTKRMTEYVEALETGGKYPLWIWPPHCLIGSRGHGVLPILFDSLVKWEESQFALVDYVTKGSNVYTEHYSAIKSEVTDPADPTTQINTGLINTLMEADLIAVAGEAGSHCLNFTVRDIASAFGDDSYVSKIVLLTDCTSPVTGFEASQDQFIKDMTAKGMQLSTSVDFLR